MTTIEDVLTYIDGSNANGRLVVAWKPFTVGNVNAAGGELEWPIVDGEVSISLYANTGAQPTGSYYVAKYELENGAVYLEQWVVPNLPTVNLGQVRVSFPPSPSVMISPLQLTSLNAQPGMFLQWDGQRWVPAYPSTFNLDPNWIAITTDASGNDVGVIGSPVHLGNSVTIHIPDAGLASRGVVTTSPQSFGGVKTFANTVNISTSIKFTLRSVAPVYGELLGFGTGGADTSLSFGGNIIASRVSPVDRPYVRADNFIGSSMDLATFGIAPTAVMPGSLANPARTLAAFLLPVAGTVDWTGIGTDTTGALWLRTGTSTSAGFLYLDTAGNVTAREFRMDPYQHLNAPGVEAARSDATMVMYSGVSDWAGYGVNSTPEIWFRMGPNASGAYYYFGAGGARFPGNLTVGNITVTGGVTLPAGTYVPTSRRIDTSTGLTGGGDLTVNRTLSVVDDTTTQRVEAALAGNLVSARHRLNFIAGTDQSINVVDDAVNNRVNITFTTTGSGGGVANSVYAVNGTIIGTRSQLNLIAGTNVTIVGADNPGAGRVDITVGIVGGGGGLVDPTTTKGDIIARGAAAPATRLGVGTDAQVLTADAASPLGLKWAVQAGGVPPTRLIIAGTGLGGGGSLAADVTLTANVVSVNGQTGAVVLTAANVGGVPTTRQVIAGTGLTGGGALSSDVTLAVVNNTTTQRLRVSKDAAGTLVGTHWQINFIQGANVGLTVADDPGNDRVNVTVAATTSGLSDPTTTKGDIIARGVAGPATRLGVGTDGQVLTASAADTLGVKWVTAASVPVLSVFTRTGAIVAQSGDYTVAQVTGAVPDTRQVIAGTGLTGGGALSGNVTLNANIAGIQTPWTQDIDGAGFTLKNAGKIGVGLAAPNFQLELQQNSLNPSLNVIPLGGYTRATIGFGCNAAMTTGWVIGEGLDSVSKDLYIVDVTAGAARMYISTAGNVGIGTTSPRDMLHVANTTDGSVANNTAVRISSNTSSFCGIRMHQANQVEYTMAIDANASTGNLRIVNTNGDQKVEQSLRGLVITKDGNVGIGTTGPTAKLDVYRTGADPSLSADNAALNIGAPNSGAQLGFGGYAGSTTLWMQTKFVNNTGAAFSLLINPLGGFVGIGANASYRLDVAGDVNCSGAFRVGGAPVPSISSRVDVTASRAVNFVYQNTSGKPVFVNVTVSVNASQFFQFLTDGGNPPTSIASVASNGAGVSATLSTSAWVMNMHFYKVNMSGGSLTTWIEWI